MQIFSNLLSNAVKYTQEGGKIQFLVEEYETKSRAYARYRFLVSDNGMGMSADFKNTIFDAFTRAESSLTNKIQGTGLGMAITRNLVEAMGGTIDVESELAKKIPIIAMTANAFSEDIQHSLAAGMNAHISKPVEMKVLEKTIRSIKSGGGDRTAGH